MVGLRWWNYVDDDGVSHWVYESRKVRNCWFLLTTISMVFLSLCRRRVNKCLNFKLNSIANFKIGFHYVKLGLKLNHLHNALRYRFRIF